jgi:diguanylate cyclase (GGDEF)-like protein
VATLRGRPFETSATKDDDDDRTAVGSAAELAATVAEKSKTQRPWLVVVRARGSGNLGQMHRLEERLVLGRATECDVQLDGGGVSRKHAMLERKADGTIEVVDLESRNGTFVNGVRVSRTTVHDGDKIQVGWSAVFKLAFQDELDETLQRGMLEAARRDALTRATNSRGFSEALTREHAFAQRHGRALSVLAFDVDHFKNINDTYGHAVGDYVLKRIVEVVTAAIRREDVLARTGGEEFVLLLRDIPLKGALECAERIRAIVQRTVFETSDASIPVTISVGVATLQPGDPATPAALVESADRAMYDAKRAGRNRVSGS